MANYGRGWNHGYGHQGGEKITFNITMPQRYPDGPKRSVSVGSVIDAPDGSRLEYRSVMLDHGDRVEMGEQGWMAVSPDGTEKRVDPTLYLMERSMRKRPWWKFWR